MRQCPLCRRTYDEVESFCYDDGTPLALISQSGFTSQSQPTVVLSPPQQVVLPQGSSATKWIFVLLGLLIAAVGVIGFLLFTRSDGNEVNRGANATANTTVENKATPSPQEKNVSTPVPLPQRPPPRPYAATTRLKFAKGAFTTGYSGDVNASDTRSFVLVCRAGQQLSATVSSGGNCVTFVSGGESYNTFTSRGDNYVTVRNGCSDAVAFRLSITVI